MKKIINLLIIIFICTGLVGHIYAIPTEEDIDKNTPTELKNVLNYISNQAGTDERESKLIYDMLSDQIEGSEGVVLHNYMVCPNTKCNVSGFNPNKTYKENIESDPHLRQMRDHINYDIQNFSKKNHNDKLMFLATSGKHLDVTLEKIIDAHDDNAFGYVIDHTRFGLLENDLNASAEKIKNLNFNEIYNLKPMLEEHSKNASLAFTNWKMIKTNGYDVKLNNTPNIKTCSINKKMISEILLGLDAVIGYLMGIMAAVFNCLNMLPGAQIFGYIVFGVCILAIAPCIYWYLSFD